MLSLPLGICYQNPGNEERDFQDISLLYVFERKIGPKYVLVRPVVYDEGSVELVKCGRGTEA